MPALDVRPLPAMIFASLRHIGPYGEAGETFRKITDWAVSEGVMTPETQILGLSYDDPKTTPAEILRYDACVTLKTPVALPPGMQLMALPACSWVMMTHKGPYETMGETFTKLYAALAEHPTLVPIATGAIEIYVNDPATTAPADLITELGVAVLEGADGF
ncbi:AraC family transcriptional regulator [Rhodospirillum rubrum]|uniref:Transcription activator, effector binding n=1 Tax=Rhodospirillum rubrum (strain ATCC 11170 / ATH 1.1.1 / DSM 467 / LMG 4362 / NCIMB 8255 / S1) TaxID=269796 RepID=Q2RP02_RHORT|nr:GyrI-like domain-containing protein [Rhodospirillum rubrum]ABC24143.1 transcription activator, effector binding [Rhodospirillum rubrum ATCC 11170]AEO49894.1 transcription activator, effector binding protein [Rhodospirillum rubrum F11]MBK5955857.1 GyrI-like domain-containing protein [Rhodospirillum rubrum]QXG80086.1 GyrI-like domain-containing protein [Rhodospirillum rubrum]HAP98842.1 GyrI-like domain-containing protein [Rhodospirillum rubrum]